MTKYDKYETEVSGDKSQYAFISSGRKQIAKKVEFSLTEVAGIENTYNCAFGDWNEEKQCIIDDSRSNNGDIAKVLATVVGTIYHFTNLYPDRIIYIEGFDKSRTNLYGKIIHENFDELSGDFDIFGIQFENEVGKINPFNGAHRYKYDAYLIKRA